MQIQSFRQPVQAKGLIPFNFNKPEKNDQEQDWGMNPNPDNYVPDFKLMGLCAGAGVFAGTTLGLIGGAYFGVNPMPLILSASLAGAVAGGGVGLAFAKPEAPKS